MNHDDNLKIIEAHLEDWLAPGRIRKRKFPWFYVVSTLISVKFPWLLIVFLLIWTAKQFSRNELFEFLNATLKAHHVVEYGLKLLKEKEMSKYSLRVKKIDDLRLRANLMELLKSMNPNICLESLELHADNLTNLRAWAALVTQHHLDRLENWSKESPKGLNKENFNTRELRERIKRVEACMKTPWKNVLTNHLSTLFCKLKASKSIFSQVKPVKKKKIITPIPVDSAISLPSFTPPQGHPDAIPLIFDDPTDPWGGIDPNDRTEKVFGDDTPRTTMSRVALIQRLELLTNHHVAS